MKRVVRFVTCLAAAGVFMAMSARPANAAGFGLCYCAPTLALLVNGVNYSNNFVATSADGQTFVISGSVVTPTFSFTLNATTSQDPGISYDVSISGDPTVAFIITQSFLTDVTDLTLTSQIGGVIQDLSGDGAASVVGSPLIQTVKVDGVTATQQFQGCSLPGGTSTLQCPSSLLSTDVLLPPPDPLFPDLHTLQLRVGFVSSDGDGVSLSGSTELNPTPVTPTSPVPEPGTLGLMIVGLPAAFGLARRRNDSRARA